MISRFVERVCGADLGDARAAPQLIATPEDLTNAPDTRHTSAVALGKLVGSENLPEIRRLAKDYPEVSTRQALLKILKQ